MGLNIVFGVAGGLVAHYVNGAVGERLGKSNVGYLASIFSFYAAVMALPYSWMGKRIGKGFMMLLGGFSLTALGLILWIFNVDDLENKTLLIIIACYLLQGSGRCVFESTNKAVYADFFAWNKEGAFAMLAVT